mmetsp:Transcript_24475/g.92472  ORF Transcript_24475/g.92472 Transcript_24475/m.92472 type:complete len:226 (-) Transcript_24475:941-1618(-)
MYWPEEAQDAVTVLGPTEACRPTLIRRARALAPRTAAPRQSQPSRCTQCQGSLKARPSSPPLRKRRAASIWTARLLGTPLPMSVSSPLKLAEPRPSGKLRSSRRCTGHRRHRCCEWYRSALWPRGWGSRLAGRAPSLPRLGWGRAALAVGTRSPTTSNTSTSSGAASSGWGRASAKTPRGAKAPDQAARPIQTRSWPRRMTPKPRELSGFRRCPRWLKCRSRGRE